MIHAKFYRKFVKNGLPKIVWPCIGITHRKIFLLKSIALKFIATLAHDKWTLKGAGLLLSGQPLIIHSSVSSILISRFLGLNKSLDLYNCITYIPMNFGYYRYGGPVHLLLIKLIYTVIWVMIVNIVSGFDCYLIIKNSKRLLTVKYIIYESFEDLVI